ncbi:hypothetical protein [Marinobacterium sediminicola]|uniref:Uncharacterized protein n=1 Tax=Marinobacterium sediminicola TaxID=518898 RepID=A0ABY1RYJ4_9GAMM|nr:hypothetical protein [Marinobacterium sediminicola]ULG68096.1 hypothetical protein LN244_10285 [Marinobacterium sediminicola]SMR73392.1 hypothetical protein SAMN04487964_10454 [Marinobacterium sediminicola]
MRPSKRESVAEIKRHLFKYNLISMAASLVIAVCIYALATGEGASIHAWLGDQSNVFDLLIGAGVIELLVMARISRLNKLKQGVTSRRRVMSRA